MLMMSHAMQAAVETQRKYKHVLWYSLFVAAYLIVLYLQRQHTTAERWCPRCAMRSCHVSTSSACCCQSIQSTSPHNVISMLTVSMLTSPHNVISMLTGPHTGSFSGVHTCTYLILGKTHVSLWKVAAHSWNSIATLFSDSVGVCNQYVKLCALA